MGTRKMEDERASKSEERGGKERKWKRQERGEDEQMDVNVRKSKGSLQGAQWWGGKKTRTEEKGLIESK